MLGEVNRPGSYNITSDQVTLFEALALAGDLTIHGRRNRVAVVRETDGVRTILYHDLRSRDVFNSPDFYLQQNDLVYVEPNRVRAEASTQNQFTNVGTWLSLISFLMSTCVPVSYTHLAREAIREHHFVFVTEGYKDVLAMHAAGFRNTVALCGTALTDQQITLLSRYTRYAIIMLDGDEAGQTNGIRSARLLVEKGFSVGRIVLESGHDPD